MSVPSSATRLLSAALLALAAGALAAPPADPKLVDRFSRMDEFHAARGVRKADAPRELPRAAPSPGLERLLDAFLDRNPNTGLIVLKDGVVLAERYQYGVTAQHRLESASMAKTVLGMLVGIALEEGKIASLDDPAAKYVPELKGHPYGDTAIRHLLTMSSGIVEDEARFIQNTLWRRRGGGADAVVEFDHRAAPAGTRFSYSSIDSHVLGLVLIHATKQPIADYLSEKIWRPMGAEANAMWIVDRGGYELAYCCLNATLRDYARFGMLLANYGALDGKQIIPAAWVKAATKPDAPHLAVGTATPYNGYGYQTWVIHKDEPRFAAFGFRGQAIFVDAAAKLVVVHTAVWADGYDRDARRAQFELFHEILAKLDHP